jgi:ABC-2 type transport system permease protein
MLWYRLQTLIRKELQALLRDPAARQLLLAPVIIQIILFPFAATLEVRNATVAVLNQDGGAASTEIIQRIAGAEAFSSVTFLQSEVDVERTVNNQQALIVLRFGDGFSSDLLAGRRAEVQAIVDGRRANSGQLAVGYVSAIVAAYQAENGASRQSSQGPRAATQVIVRNWYNPNLMDQWFVIPSLVAIITTIGCLIVTALSVAREREQGTLDQVLVSPLSPAMIMVGKTIPAVMIATVQATIIILAAIFVYGVPFTGSLLLLYASILFYALSLAGFGLFISAISSTQQQAFLGTFVFMLPAILLSGFIAPVENMPPILQWISWLDPLRHSIVIVKGLFLKDFGVSEVFANLWPLAIITVLVMGAAYAIFRKGTA